MEVPLLGSMWPLPQGQFLFCSSEREDLLLNLGAICSQELERVHNLLRREIVSDLRVGAATSRERLRSVQADRSSAVFDHFIHDRAGHADLSGPPGRSKSPS